MIFIGSGLWCILQHLFLISKGKSKKSTDCRVLGDSDLKIVAIDRSHIVGHVNSDGSIRPVVNVQDAAASNVVVLTSTAAPDLTSVSRLEHDYVRDEKTELFETTSNDLFKENTT